MWFWVAVVFVLLTAGGWLAWAGVGRSPVPPYQPSGRRPAGARVTAIGLALVAAAFVIFFTQVYGSGPS